MAERGRAGSGAVRIVGGALRGRRVRFHDAPGLRPTGDRVRETLFNWLAPVIAGSRCLDLYAGSGALGIEAASRGAAAVCLVERDPQVARQISAAVRELDLARLAAVEVVTAAAQAYLARAPAQPCDIVFLDPPFAADELPAVLARLAGPGWLAPEARVYIEQPRSAGLPALPQGWRWHRNRVTGQVGYHLAVAATPGAGVPT